MALEEQFSIFRFLKVANKNAQIKEISFLQNQLTDDPARNMYIFFWEDVFAQKFGDDSKEGSAENVGFLTPVYKSSHLIP